ncbi:hypothetical protein BJ508DRAFT_41715 [Ascobolus immersus RN42]|uniref:Smr domain-containing protein n=1 Tax=Ascobolus immersus RN42 TaxID=1160509 RepID=A0A3N4IDC3_ASCIM|nr:hypothetical protein BJ508DRAFT_41715 [Ascobolus immersus RN42]
MSAPPDEQVLAKLEAVFCPTLDSTLVHLIYADTNNYEEAYESLSQLKEQALVDFAMAESSDSQNQSAEYDWRSETDMTNFSWTDCDGRSRNNSSSGSSVTTSSSVGNWDDVGDKVGNLAELKFMLPDLPSLTIELAYKKYKGDYNKVVDHLLNAQYLLGENEIPNGVDGFFEEAEMQYEKKGKKKKKGKKVNNQLDLQEQYRFLDGTEESNLPKPFSAALKSPSNATSGRLLDATNYAKIVSQVPTSTPRAPWAVTSRLPTSSYSSPSTPTESSDEWINVPGRRRSTSGSANPYLPPPRKIETRNTSSKDARALADAYSNDTSDYFDRARQAYRRANRNNHLGGLATYYADLGRETLEAAKQYSELAQYRIVDENSRSRSTASMRAGYADDCVDLHGVTVPVAKKIVREKLGLWWGGGRLESEVMKQPFKIITGMGKNSQDGKPRLLPEIALMLAKEGWRYRIEMGSVFVYSPKKTNVKTLPIR